MPAWLRDRFFIVWVLLVVVTLFSSEIGGSNGSGFMGSSAAVTVAVLAIAFTKVGLVMFTYMDVRGAPLMLRALCSAWIVIVFGILMAIYFGVSP